MKSGIFLLFVFLLFILPIAPAWPARTALFQTESYSASGVDSLQLGHSFILKNTLIVVVNTDTLTQDSNYTIDTVHGILHFHAVPDSGDTIIVSYRKLPLFLALRYRHWTRSDTVFADSTMQTKTIKRIRPETDTGYESELQKSGSIFRGVTLGTDQGMRLQSGLRLQVSGKVARNVEVVASLTDQNTPIQPEGNTQTLQEIDKVFINIKTPHFLATMGDFVFEASGSQFGTYSRKLQGAMGTASGDWGNFSIAAAGSRGTFTTNHFIGQEGNQGPYQLTGSKGQREIIVLAGTEKVWIDGEPMTRGEENDYIIEYGNGQITFTRNRLITSDSRITVDFEYSDQKFQKNIYGAVGEIHLLKNRLQLKTTLLRESDDKENPLDIPLTDAYRAVLENAGDDPDSATYSGAVYVGETKGYYEKVDSSGLTRYIYTGENKGNYNVRFSYVGESKGDYSFQGYGIYRYEGPGKGAYLPVLFLPPATSHQMATLQSNLQLTQGIWLNGEIGISDQDLNLYSSRDDQDNTDAAYSGQFKMNKRSISVAGTGLGELGLEVFSRVIGSQFRPVGRLSEVEHGRKWGTSEGVVWGEKVYEIKTDYNPMTFWNIGTEYGTFSRQDGFASDRKRINTSIQAKYLPRLAYDVEWIDSKQDSLQNGFWLRHNGSLSGTWKWFQPSIKYDGEHRRDEIADTLLTGFQFDEWSALLKFQKKTLQIGITEAIRDDRQYTDNKLSPYSLATTSQINFEWKNHTGLAASMLYTHRNRDYNNSAGEDQKTDLADMKIQLTPTHRIVYGMFNYRFSSTQVSEMVRDTLDVGEGLGNYRFDSVLNELVPDQDGNLLLRSIQTGIFLPVNNLQAGVEFRFDLSRAWKKGKGFKNLLSKLSGKSMLRLERRDKKRDFLSVNRSVLHPRWGEDSTTVMAVQSFHQDFEYIPSKNGFSIRLRYRKDDSETNQFTQDNYIRHRSEKSIRMKGAFLKKYGFFSEYINRNDLKTYAAQGRSNKDISGHTLTAEASFRPKQKYELAIKANLQWAQDHEPVPAVNATSFFLIPRFTYSLRQKGQIRVEIEFGEVHASPEGALPYEMLNGDQPGRTVRWTLLTTYKVTGHVMATLTYRGRQEPWRKKMYQTGQMEVRAFF